MPKPIIGPCGQQDQPPCPPTPAAVAGEPLVYTLSDMKAHGDECYRKRRVDARIELSGPAKDDL